MHIAKTKKKERGEASHCSHTCPFTYYFRCKCTIHTYDLYCIYTRAAWCLAGCVFYHFSPLELDIWYPGIVYSTVTSFFSSYLLTYALFYANSPKYTTNERRCMEKVTNVFVSSLLTNQKHDVRVPIVYIRFRNDLRTMQLVDNSHAPGSYHLFIHSFFISRLQNPT